MTTDKDLKKLSHPEIVKLNSNYIRGTLKEELDSNTPTFSADNQLLLKFHGIYAQTDRDQAKSENKSNNYHSVMLRGRLPGGRLSSKQYLIWDTLAETCSAGTLRLTTRQSVQLHGILKGNIRKLIRGLNDGLMTSTGACGDVVRNVMQPVNPWNSPDLKQLDDVCTLISDRYKMQALSYSEIWLDGEMISEISPKEKSTNPEPIYGETYLPRKFKVCVTVAGNNSVDVFSHDLGIVASLDINDRITGYWILVGGGFGTTINIPTTFPRLADCLGWVPVNKLIEVCDAIIITQRDHGDRTNRRQARFKYLIAKKGVEWFKGEVEKRAGAIFENRELPEWKTPSYLGWHSQVDGAFSLGLHILSGRIKDSSAVKMKTALREIVQSFGLDVQLTPEQDLILLNIPSADRDNVKKIFDAHGVSIEPKTPIYNRAMSCVAFPTCSLAIAESERYLPGFLENVSEKLAGLGMGDRSIVIRVTGCPNGCARPYNAEIGLVGELPGKYALWLGGEPEGTRLAVRIGDKYSDQELPNTLSKFFSFWKVEQKAGETFGDWAFRTGKDRLMEIIENPNLEVLGSAQTVASVVDSQLDNLTHVPSETVEVKGEDSPPSESLELLDSNSSEEEIEEDLTSVDGMGVVTSQQTKKKLRTEVRKGVEVKTEEVTVQREEVRKKDGKKLGSLISKTKSKKIIKLEN